MALRHLLKSCHFRYSDCVARFLKEKWVLESSQPAKTDKLVVMWMQIVKPFLKCHVVQYHGAKGFLKSYSKDWFGLDMKCVCIFKMWEVSWVLFFLFPKNTFLDKNVQTKIFIVTTKSFTDEVVENNKIIASISSMVRNWSYKLIVLLSFINFSCHRRGFKYSNATS